MNINGKNGFACVTNRRSLSNTMVPKPLPGLPVIRGVAAARGRRLAARLQRANNRRTVSRNQAWAASPVALWCQTMRTA